MNAHEDELEELRRRVERLEGEVAALRGSPTTPMPAVAPVPAMPGPPLLPPVIEPAVAREKPRTLSDRVGSVPSTVWVAGAGAVIFLIGAIYGLTVSIQRGWISPPMRVGAGLLTGLAVGVFAGRLLFRGRRELGVTLLAVAAGTWTFSLYFGAKSAQLFPLGLGFGGAAVATLLAGAIAARVRSDGAMAVALAVGLAAPLAFSDGTGTLPGLLGYLGGLAAAQLVAHYVTGAGADWTWSRLLGSAGIWGVTLLGTMEATIASAPAAFALLALLLALGLGLAWLPRHRAPAQGPVAVSTLVLAAAALALWAVWRRAHLEREFFSAVLVGLAALSLALVAAGRRSGRELNEMPLVLLAAVFGLIAVPMAVDWRWVTLAWSAGALGLALAARVKARVARDDSLSLGAGIVAMAATAVWLIQALGQRRADLIFVNPVFGGAVLTAAAWAFLMTVPGQARGLAFAAMQAVAVNAVAWELSRAIGPVTGDEVAPPLGALLATLTYAASGAALWLRGVLYEGDPGRARALRLAGYGWLAVAAVKLLGFDLGNRDLLFRAVAALGVGAVFIGAALWADRHRARHEKDSAS